MKVFIILLLLFLSYDKVFAKTITTPYYEVGEVDINYQVKTNERKEKITYYKQEKITKDFKYLEAPNSEYNIKTTEVKYGKYSNFTKEKKDDETLDEDTKTIYYYQELKKIDTLTISDIDNLLITNITIKYQEDIIYEGDSKKIKLNKEYSPEYLTLEITCFLNQEDLKGSFKIKNKDYINTEITVTDKGYSKVNLKLINCLLKTIYDEKVLKTSNIEDKFYINIIDKVTLYRYRKKYYKCYKEEIITDTKVNLGYRVIETIDKYYLYRKEEIEVYDDIKLSNYLDLSKVIKSSTIPINKLTFEYTNNCSKTTLTIKYKDFKETIDINFSCKVYSKSKRRIGKTKSLKREIFSRFFKTIILRKL